MVPRAQLEASALFTRPRLSMSTRIRESSSGIIAEHKRRSPSKSIINQKCSVEDIARGYEKAGASGMSVLTDSQYFGGSLEDLLLARASSGLPLLRKDFMISEYQLLEAKAFGADVVLLIAACLPPAQLGLLAKQAKSLGLEVLMEVHNLAELKSHFTEDVDMVGVNNRDLKTFNVDLGISESLAEHIPEKTVRISESGISSPEVIKRLQQFGYHGFLLGEHFMKQEDPATEAKAFIKVVES